MSAPTFNPGNHAAAPAVANGMPSWPSGPTEPIIRIEHLNHTYGEGETQKQVLYDNNLEIMPGEIVIMTGPSGSGKTTLLTLIGALRSVQDGLLQVMGRNLGRLSARELVAVRRDIGFIFQAHNLFESLTALQNVKMALQLKNGDARAARDRAVEVLTALGLEDRIYYKPDSLSGGQRQRVAIARALANRPRLILADEPTAALDEKSGRNVVNLLQKLAKEEGSTSLIVTHDNRILDVADRIVSLVDGKIKSNVLAKESVAVCLFLSRCAAFTALTPDTLSKVAEKMSKERYPANAVIFRQGDVGDKFYLIRRGSVDVVFNQGQPTERLLATLKEGDFFGEMALLTGEPRSATIVTRENAEMYVLGKADFKNALDTSASFKEQLYKVFFQRQ